MKSRRRIFNPSFYPEQSTYLRKIIDKEAQCCLESVLGLLMWVLALNSLRIGAESVECVS